MDFKAKKFEESDIQCWIEQSLEDERLSNLNIHLSGTTDGKNDGFASDIFFAKATGLDENGTIREIHVALKVSKEYGQIKDTDDFLKLLSEREVLVYKHLFPALRKFQHDKNVAAPFDAVPKCYKTFNSDDKGVMVLVLEDLKPFGYVLHDKTLSMDARHIQLVLRQYSKFHAASFAMRDQKPKEYEALAEKCFCHYERLCGCFRNTLMEKITQHLKEASREDLAEKFSKAMGKGIENVMSDILRDEVEQSVVIHGDCHSNNLMFKYDEEGKPTRAMIVDWQVSFPHSPVLDLSYFLYQVAGEEINGLRGFLEFYHQELAKNLEGMGTDAGKVFPFSTLMEHWRKYSSYGFIFTIAFLDLFFMEEGTKVEFDSVNIKYLEAYRRKLIPAVEYYCNNTF